MEEVSSDFQDFQHFVPEEVQVVAPSKSSHHPEDELIIEFPDQVDLSSSSTTFIEDVVHEDVVPDKFV